MPKKSKSQTDSAPAVDRAAHGSLALRFAALPVDIQDALADVGEEMIRARAKFPGTKHLTGALMEEVGEVAKELLEGGDNVWGECVQAACVALRIATEGDSDYMPEHRGCAACDRGDFQLGHAEWCPANDKVSYHANNAGGAHGKDTNDK